MKRFEEGKSYGVAGGGNIIITRRTAKFITFAGDFSGRKKVIEWDVFGQGEFVWLKRCRNNFKTDVLCCAGYEN